MMLEGAFEAGKAHIAKLGVVFNLQIVRKIFLHDADHVQFLRLAQGEKIIGELMIILFVEQAEQQLFKLKSYQYIWKKQCIYS